MYNPILFSRKTRLRKSRHCGQVKCESQSCLMKSRVVRGSIFISPAQPSQHSCWIVAAHLARSQVARCHTGQSAAVRQSRQSGRHGVCLSQARSASCAPLADARTHHDNCMQYRRNTDQLLQFSTVRCTSGDVRCTSACSKHSCPRLS